MMDFNFDFDPKGVTPASVYEPIPTGTYVAVITGSEVKPTKSGSGHYLQLVVEIIDGHQKGRKIFERLNIRNTNPTAEKIAQETLASIALAVGQTDRFRDPAVLHDRPMQIDVIVEPAKGEYSASNRVKRYASVTGNAPAATVAAPTSVKPAAATPPWKR